MTNKELYYTVVDQLPLFFKPWWLDTVCNGGWDVAMISSDTHVLGVWPYQLEKKFGFSIIRNPLLTPYLGPLWLSGEEPVAEWIPRLWQQLPKSDFVQWSCIPEFKDQQSFPQSKIDHVEKVTYFIDLSLSEEILWNQMHTTRRNGIRKGEKELEVSVAELDIEKFVQWHGPSFEEKHKKYPYTQEFLSKITTEAKRQGSSVCYTAKNQDGHIMGVLWLACDQTKMYYLLSATALQTHRGAMALLTWKAILDAKKRGLLVFDFEGSMDPGIARFFQRFGGTKMQYDDFSVTYSPLWKLKCKLLG